uniref:Uncharacterized protein LOC111107128 n=1 Tax=Crassostrea virginica TaxID=6565 RepID=A0A8B8B343_CRAVI|nr:uncharacterized protein LOC111107128 [Crassostrea virginica]
MDCDIGHKSSNADSYRPLTEATESQPGVTIEEIMQKMREREIEILLRAGFPEGPDKSDTISIISNTCSTISISETESESDSEFTTITELNSRTSLSTWSLEINGFEQKEEPGEVDSVTGETDNQESMTSFAESLFCFPCCFKKKAPLAHTKKQDGKQQSLFKRFRDFLQRTILRRGHR